MTIAAPLSELAYPLDQLDQLDGNPHRGDVEAVKRSYSTFGQRKPIVARHTSEGRAEVTAGNTQLQAASELGWSHIAVVFVDDDDLTAKAWSLADNHSAELGITDEAALIAFLQALSDPDLLRATSYSEADIARLLGDAFKPGTEPESRLDEVTPQTCPSCGFKWRHGIGGEVVAVEDD